MATFFAAVFGWMLPTVAQANERIPGLPGHDEIAETVHWHTAPLEDAAMEYRKDFGGFPTGSNRDICRQLYGLNPKQKRYAQIYVLALFDDQGNLLDPWLEPYRFTVRGGRMRLISRNYEHDAHRSDHLILYAPTPQITKARYTSSNCYKIALATRLLVQQRHEVPPFKRLPHLLADENQDGSPIFFHLGVYADTHFTKQMTDEWGTPFVVKLAGHRVKVSSKHTDYEATEPFTP